MQARMSFIALLVTSCLIGCSGSPAAVLPAGNASAPSSAPQAAAQPDTYESQAKRLSSAMVATTDSLDNDALTTMLDSWFAAFAQSRIIPLNIPQRENTAYGPWYAPKDYGTPDARDDGALTEWADNYFITHDWSDYGQQILSAIPGDQVTVNDRTMTITDIFNYPKDGFYEEVVQVVGKDHVILQTCYPDSDQNRIAYGTWNVV